MTGTATSPKRGLARFWPLLPMALILIVLMFEDLDVMGFSLFGQDACGMRELDHSGYAERFYSRVANWGVHAAGSPRVAVLPIDQPELLNDVCASRAFLTQLVPDLAKLGAQVIMIDKSYSESSCGTKTITDQFRSVLERSPVPVVVGEHSVPLDSASGHGGCLAKSNDSMSFKPGSSVLQGLMRLNGDTLQIPIRWPIFDSVKLQEDQADTLSLVAAQAADPGVETRGMLPRLLSSGVHPYTTFIDLPTVNAMTAICSAEAQPVDIHGNPIDCEKNGWRRPPHDLTIDHQSLLGKVVVVGDLSDDDMQHFPGGDKPGFYLHANYVESLLDQRFLTEVPAWVTVIVLVLFIIAVYCLYWAHDREQKPYFSSPEKAFVASLVLFGGLLLLSFQLLIIWQYFTPLWALWGAGFFLVFRYLEESGHHRSQHLMATLKGEPQHATAASQSHPRENGK
jgi:hypothetical protein